MSKIALTPNASGDGVFTITAPNSGTDRAIALPDAAGTIPLLAAASNTAITSTPAELNILDGVTATAAEINLIDGGTARGTTAVADGDGFLTNDGGTMRMTKVETLATYIGTKVGGGAMVFIASSGAISNAATVAFTAFDASAFDHYVFMMQYVIPATDGVKLFCQTSTDGGSNFATTSGNYHHGGTVDAIGLLVTESVVGSDTDEDGVSGRFEIYAPHVANRRTTSQSFASLVSNSGSNYLVTFGDGEKATSHRFAEEDTDAVRFLFTSGNIESGEIVMYGIANA